MEMASIDSKSSAFLGEVSFDTAESSLTLKVMQEQHFDEVAQHTAEVFCAHEPIAVSFGGDMMKPGFLDLVYNCKETWIKD